MLKAPPNATKENLHQAGFVLISALVILLLISILGAWALNSSKFELDIAGGLQRAEFRFNIAEGGTNLEAYRLGYATSSQFAYYQVADPTRTNTVLTPTTDADFDPGNDTTATTGGISTTDSATWPMQNLLGSAADDEFDYRYLITYLYPDVPPKGYDASSFSGYKFRIQGQGVVGGVASSIVEEGGIKVGVKASM